MERNPIGDTPERHRTREGLMELVAASKSFQEIAWMLEPWADREMGYPALVDDSGEPVDPGAIIEELAQLEIADGEGDCSEIAPLAGRIAELARLAERLHQGRRVLREIYEHPRAVPGAPEATPLLVHAARIDDPALEPYYEPSPDASPVAFVPGLSDSPIPMRRLAFGMAEHGRSVMTFKMPPRTAAADPRYEFDPSAPAYTMVNASAALAAIEYAQAEVFQDPDAASENGAPRPVDAVGYSFGAITTVYAALARPELFRSIVLLNPSGITDADRPRISRFLSLAARSLAANAAHRKIAETERGAGHFIGEMLTEKSLPPYEGGVATAVTVADAIAQVDLVPLLEQLEAKGVCIAIVPAESDVLFDIDKSIAPFAHPLSPDAESAIPAYDLTGPHINQVIKPGAVASVLTDVFAELSKPKSIPIEMRRAA